MIKLVLIDFDDTLAMTEEACFVLENEVAVQLGMEPMSRQTHQRNWGKPLAEAIVERLPGVNVEEYLKLSQQIHQRHVDEGLIDVVSDENLQVLEQLKMSGMAIAILTSRTRNEVAHLLEENHKLSATIDTFYHGDNLEYAKPDPRVFDKPLNDFQVSPTEAVYIGDSPSDGLAAKGTGLHFIAYLESGLRSKVDFASIQVDGFTYTFEEMPGILATM